MGAELVFIRTTIAFAIVLTIFGCSSPSSSDDTSVITSSSSFSSEYIASSSSTIEASSTSSIQSNISSSSLAVSSSSSLTAPSSSSQLTPSHSSSSSIATNSSSSKTENSSSSISVETSSSSSRTCSYNQSKNELKCSEQTYKTVTIGNQTWMAENMNTTPSVGNSSCYNDDQSNCNTFGRLYDWEAAMSVCPIGWHVPDTTEWLSLRDYIGGGANANKLKAVSSEWQPYNGITNTDDFGFSALPGGGVSGSSNPTYSYKGMYAMWWTSTVYSQYNSYQVDLFYNSEYLHRNNTLRQLKTSVRCLMD